VRLKAPPGFDRSCQHYVIDERYAIGEDETVMVHPDALDYFMRLGFRRFGASPSESILRSLRTEKRRHGPGARCPWT
jgi:hypothetical protein